MADCDYNFQRQYTLRGSMLRIATNLGSGEDLEGLVQSFQLQLQRQMTTVYDLTSDDIYIVEGNPQGQFASSKVLAGFCGTPLDCSCDEGTISLETIRGQCDEACEGEWVLENVFQQAFSLQGQVSDKVMSASAQYTFTHISS